MRQCRVENVTFSHTNAPELGNFSRQGATLCLTTKRFIERILGLTLRGELLLAAVSGGADSLALLTVLCALRDSMGHRVMAVHVDHGLRPESRAEGLAVVSLCAHWGIEGVLREIPVQHVARQHGLGLEEAGRKLRYAVLDEEQQRHKAAWICTGHHNGDLEEDILLRLLRGTGWPALGGMPALDVQRHVLRPLLHADPEALRALLQSCDIAWAEDSSNADIRFTRNRLRHGVLPLLRVESPSLGTHMRHLWQMARDDAHHWDVLLDELCTQHQVSFAEHAVHLPAELLKEVDRATRMRLYMRAVHQLTQEWSQGQARASTLFELDDAWEQGRGGTFFQLPGRITAAVRRRAITFHQSTDKPKTV